MYTDQMFHTPIVFKKFFLLLLLSHRDGSAGLRSLCLYVCGPVALSVCLSVCLSLSLSLSVSVCVCVCPLTQIGLPRFRTLQDFRRKPTCNVWPRMARSSSDGNAMRYVLPIFLNHVTFTHNGSKQIRILR